MKILYFCQLYFPAIYGGGEYIFFYWAKELVRRGHKVYVVAQRIRGGKDYEVIDGINVYRTGPAVEYKGSLPLNLFENLGYIVGALLKGLMLILKNRIDIIHSNTYAPAIAGQICAIISKKPHIITFHDVYHLSMKRFWNKWASHSFVGSSIAKIGPYIEKLVLKLPATLFHTPSETSKRDLRSCGLRKVIVIPNGLSLREYDSIDVENVNVHQAIFVGRLVFYKNLDIAVKAMKKITTKIPDVRLLVIGDGPERVSLKSLVEKLGLDRNIIFEGRVSDETKIKKIKESSFLILPSVCEGFGIVIIEAFACYKPVIVSDVEPLSELVENRQDGLLVSPFDFESWAEAMLFLFTQPEFSREMGKRGREKTEQKYTIQRVVDQLEKTYMTLIE